MDLLHLHQTLNASNYICSKQALNCTDKINILLYIKKESLYRNFYKAIKNNFLMAIPSS